MSVNCPTSAMPHVLIIDTDEPAARQIGAYLESQGLRVSVVADESTAIKQLAVLQPDLAILDMNLPGEAGVAVCQRVRQNYAGLILVLDAQDNEALQVQALDGGADDYVARPVSQRVLLARIHALLRREAPAAAQSAICLTFRALKVDGVAREASLNGELIDLTGAEFDLLWLLASHAGSVLTREAIFEQLRGIKYDGQDRSIDVRVSRVRAKIGDDPYHPQRIKTVRSKGYLFVQHL